MTDAEVRRMLMRELESKSAAADMMAADSGLSLQLPGGAGVIGLAVGFGAQKPVQDVISGIFFLVDDAFRTGEYIETAGMRGTVEKISVRSLQ